MIKYMPKISIDEAFKSGEIEKIIQSGKTTYKLLKNVIWNQDNWIGKQKNQFKTDLTGKITTELEDNWWLEIGNNTIFDGNYYSITINVDNWSGLFETNSGSSGSRAVVQNLEMICQTISGAILRENHEYVNLLNCCCHGEIIGGGGLCVAGLGNTTIENCFSTGKITGTYAGGICGATKTTAKNVIIRNSYSTGEIEGTNAGGIYGSELGIRPDTIFDFNTKIMQCYSTGNITGSSAGGIFGYLSNNILIIGCCAFGDNQGYGIGYSGYIDSNFNIIKSSITATTIFISTIRRNLIHLNKPILYSTVVGHTFYPSYCQGRTGFSQTVLSDENSALPTGEKITVEYVINPLTEEKATIIDFDDIMLRTAPWIKIADNDYRLRTTMFKSTLSTPVVNFNNINFSDSTASGIKINNISGSTLIRSNLTNIDFDESVISNSNFTTANLTNISFVTSTINSDVIFQNTVFNNVDFTGQTLSNNFNGANFVMTTLTNADLKNCDLQNATLSNNDLRKTQLPLNLSNVDFQNTNLSGNDLSIQSGVGYNITGAKFNGSNLSKTILFGQDLSGYDFTDTNFTETDLSVNFVILNTVTFQNTNLTQTNLQGQDLKSIDIINSTLNNTNLSETDLSGKDLVGVQLEGSNLSAANLSNAILTNVDLSNINLSNANLSDVDLITTTLYGAILHGANLTNSNLSGKDLSNLNFTDAILENADLSNVTVSNTRFENTKLNGIKLNNVNLNDFDFTGVDLENATLQGITVIDSDLIGTKFTHADFTNSNLSGCRLIGVNMDQVTLNQTNFINSKIIGSNLTNSDLSGCDFTDATLNTVDLTSSDLTDAVLTRTFVIKCNLTDSNLTNADFTNANLTGSILTNNILTNTIFNTTQILQQDIPSGLDNSLFNVTTQTPGTYNADTTKTKLSITEAFNSDSYTKSVQNGITTYTLTKDIVWNEISSDGKEKRLIINGDEVFDGDSHIIVVPLSITAWSGLFECKKGSLQQNPVIKNLGIHFDETTSIFGGGGIIYTDQLFFDLENCYTNGTAVIGGGLVGNTSDTSKRIDRKITNCYSTGDIGSGGGIIGNNPTGTKITNCFSTGKILSGSGGITSKITKKYYDIEIKNCFSTGELAEENSGGIIGKHELLSEINNVELLIDNCFSTGEITGESAGGICGLGENANIRIHNCFSFGNITGQYAGGICSLTGNNLLKIENSRTYGEISGTGAGGFIGSLNLSNTDIIIENSYSKGIIQSDGSGGLIGSNIGDNNNSIKILRCHTTGNIIGIGCGGMLGSEVVCNSVISECYSTGIISGEGSGGIVGSKANKLEIKNCYTTGEIIGTNAGGVIGEQCSTISPSLIVQSCYTSGNIIAENGGGLMGSKCGASNILSMFLFDCFTTGDIVGQSSGGLLGSETRDINIFFCYSNGNIIGTNSGGLIGNISERSLILSSYSSGMIKWNNGSGIVGSIDTDANIFIYLHRKNMSPINIGNNNFLNSNVMSFCNGKYNSSITSEIPSNLGDILTNTDSAHWRGKKLNFFYLSEWIEDKNNNNSYLLKNNLFNMDLDNFDLSDLNLKNIDLSGSILRDTKINNSIFDNVKIDNLTILPNTISDFQKIQMLMNKKSREVQSLNMLTLVKGDQIGIERFAETDFKIILPNNIINSDYFVIPLANKEKILIDNIEYHRIDDKLYQRTTLISTLEINKVKYDIENGYIGVRSEYVQDSDEDIIKFDIQNNVVSFSLDSSINSNDYDTIFIEFLTKGNYYLTFNDIHTENKQFAISDIDKIKAHIFNETHTVTSRIYVKDKSDKIIRIISDATTGSYDISFNGNYYMYTFIEQSTNVYSFKFNPLLISAGFTKVDIDFYSDLPWKKYRRLIKIEIGGTTKYNKITLNNITDSTELIITIIYNEYEFQPKIQLYKE